MNHDNSIEEGKGGAHLTRSERILIMAESLSKKQVKYFHNNFSNFQGGTTRWNMIKEGMDIVSLSGKLHKDRIDEIVEGFQSLGYPIEDDRSIGMGAIVHPKNDYIPKEDIIKVIKDLVD